MLVAALAALATIYLLVGLLVLAPRKIGYSHIKHTISELGERGSSTERIVAYGLFLPVGVLLLAVAYLARAESSPTAAFALCVAIGYIGAAIFPCDPGSPVSGTARQGLHNLAGAVEYVGGGLALMTLADTSMVFRVAGVAVLGNAFLLSVLPANAIRGLIQRIAEACLFGSLVVAAWTLPARV